MLAILSFKYSVRLFQSLARKAYSRWILAYGTHDGVFHACKAIEEAEWGRC
jgi:hypothetical protein